MFKMKRKKKCTDFEQKEKKTKKPHWLKSLKGKWGKSNMSRKGWKITEAVKIDGLKNINGVHSYFCHHNSDLVEANFFFYMFS